jgi:hypothetical protein
MKVYTNEGSKTFLANKAEAKRRPENLNEFLDSSVSRCF